MFSRLDIGHDDFIGTQFVYCKPFKSLHTETRMDCVFFIPPRPFFDVGGRRRLPPVAYVGTKLLYQKLHTWGPSYCISLRRSR